MHLSSLCTGFHIGFFEKGGGGGESSDAQETVPITNALTARIRVWKKFEQLHTFLLQQLSLLRFKL